MLFDKVPIQDYFKNLFKFDIDYEVENPNYRCLRGAVHVMNGTKVLLWLDLIIIPIYTIFFFPYTIPFIILHIPIIFSALYALKKEKQRYMWPLTILSAIEFFIWALITAFKFFFSIYNTDYFLRLYGQGHHEDMFIRWGIVILIKVICITYGAFLFWRLTVFHTTRKYLEAKEDGAVDVSDPEQASGLEKLMKPI